MNDRDRLQAALDEAERQARAALATERDTGVWHVEHEPDDWANPDGPLDARCLDGRCDHRVVDGPGIRIYDEGGHDGDQAEHIARWDPATVLRFIARDRQLLATYAVYEKEQFPNHDGGYADALVDQISHAADCWTGSTGG